MSKINQLNNFLRVFKIQASCEEYRQEGAIHKYSIHLNPGSKIGKLQALVKELMLFFKAAILPKLTLNTAKGLIELDIIETLPTSKSLIYELVDTKISNEEIPIFLGYSYDDVPIKIDLAQNPHMLIGGTTGSGKSSLLHNITTNLILHNQCQLFIIDTKEEFNFYKSYLNNSYVISNFKETIDLLYYLISKMNQRYKEHKKEQPIVLIIDEFADLIMQDKEGILYNSLCCLIQKCRAAQIYCILATQRPSFKILDGTIKANLPARLSCRTASKIDSRIILDSNGAEELFGAGDCIINNYKYNKEKFKFLYSSTTEIAGFLRAQMATST